MSQKTYIPSGETVLSSQIGATFEALAATIAARREAGEESYTSRLLTGSPDGVLKKVMEEAGETALAAKEDVYKRQTRHRCSWKSASSTARPARSRSRTSSWATSRS